jgi:transposase
MPFALLPWVYRQRNLVGHFFNSIWQFRGVATTYGKDPINFLPAIKLIAVRIYCL